MTLGVERLQAGLLRHPVRLVIHGLAPFVLDHLPLVVQLRLIDGREQPAHSIGFEPEGPFEVRNGNNFPVVGPVLGGRTVEPGADLFQRPEKIVVVVLTALEHEVFEQVGESRASRDLVLAAHVIPEVDGRLRQTVVFVEDYRESVSQSVPAERDVETARGMFHHWEETSDLWAVCI